MSGGGRQRAQSGGGLDHAELCRLRQIGFDGQGHREACDSLAVLPLICDSEEPSLDPQLLPSLAFLRVYQARLPEGGLH